MSESDNDKEPRVTQPITRRDLLNGVPLTAGASVLPDKVLGQDSGPDHSPQGIFLFQGHHATGPSILSTSIDGDAL
jgi:hypothetical protein